MQEEDQDDYSDDGSSLVRPYIITGGRTKAKPSEIELSIESLVKLTQQGKRAGLEFEKQQIADLCPEPTAIGEISSHLGVPLGVATVLVSDMVGDGLLEASETATNEDTQTLERLIEGIRAL